ncbi:MAG TPA: YciI family protein [Candidatus Limnocylindria bacterium]|nr:YciI family protein [Candidatus Limnocylindria bacterium]
MSKFVLIVNFEGGVVDTPMEEWKPEEVQAHLDYYRALNRELRASGELIETAVLAGPELAKVVTSNGKGSPMVTDGPFQEFKEWAAGYQIVDVESEARALEIAGRISAVPGPNGIPTEQPIQVRQLMESSPRTTTEMAEWLETVGGTH